MTGITVIVPDGTPTDAIKGSNLQGRVDKGWLS